MRHLVYKHDERVTGNYTACIPGDCDCLACSIQYYVRLLRDNNDPICKLDMIIASISNNVFRQHLRRVHKHVCCLGLSYRLLGHEAAAGKGKPTAVYGDLYVIWVCNDG